MRKIMLVDETVLSDVLINGGTDAQLMKKMQSVRLGDGTEYLLHGQKLYAVASTQIMHPVIITPSDLSLEVEPTYFEFIKALDKSKKYHPCKHELTLALCEAPLVEELPIAMWPFVFNDGSETSYFFYIKKNKGQNILDHEAMRKDAKISLEREFVAIEWAV